MTKERIHRGKAGEKVALKLLEKDGYRILEQNYQNLFGEIDIIAVDKKIICFIEVKTRRTNYFGSGFESVTPLKQKKISKVAISYLKSKGLLGRDARFDVIAVQEKTCGEMTVNILKNAFPLSGPYVY